MNMPMNNKRSIFDEIVAIKSEQLDEKNNLRKEFSSSFLKKLDDWFKTCYMNDVEKKEFFVTKEKLSLELLKLLQSQKKFKDSELLQNQICSVAVFDPQTNLLGRVISFNLEEKTVEFITMPYAIQNDPTGKVIKKLNEIELFDPFSLTMEIYYKKQKTYYDGFNYKDTFTMLTGIEKKATETEQQYNYLSVGRGIPLDKKIKNRIDNIDLKD